MTVAAKNKNVICGTSESVARNNVRHIYALVIRLSAFYISVTREAVNPQCLHGVRLNNPYRVLIILLSG